MEDYNKVIESLSVRYIKAKELEITQPVRVTNTYDVENTLFLASRGVMAFGDSNEKVNEGELLFLPAGKMTSVSYGSSNATSVHTITNEDFIGSRERYLRKRNEGSNMDYFSYITFDAKVFDSVSLFTSLDMPPFVIKSAKLAYLLKELIKEVNHEEAGKNRVIAIFSDQIVIEILRYILSNQLFVEKLATNSTYFKDPRLIDIFSFIKEHLQEDLSNKVLANVANVSEDYVGQYFKMMTGINPQDYIEYQRMEAAVHLLRTSKKSIRMIGNEVGYKDTAYFCRRFKMMFGIPAGKMRRRESLMSM
ncbi:MAG: AraC family transcriptional regulator [Cytophagales bacterium]|nr:MAG: AraC family transcriptional regulator [Cytophagales bacterium]